MQADQHRHRPSHFKLKQLILIHFIVYSIYINSVSINKQIHYCKLLRMLYEYRNRYLNIILS